MQIFIVRIKQLPKELPQNEQFSVSVHIIIKKIYIQLNKDELINERRGFHIYFQIMIIAIFAFSYVVLYYLISSLNKCTKCNTFALRFIKLYYMGRLNTNLIKYRHLNFLVTQFSTLIIVFSKNTRLEKEKNIRVLHRISAKFAILCGVG